MKKWLSGSLATLLLATTLGGTSIAFAETTELQESTETEMLTAEIQIISPNLEHEGLPFVTTVEFEEGANAFDLLLEAVGEDELEYTVDPEYGVFVEGILGLDGTASDWWMFNVNDEFSMVGASSYIVEDGDVLEWLYHVDGFDGWEEFAFADQDLIAEWAQEATQLMGALGLIEGKPSGDDFVFDPKGITTRAEFTKILVSLLFFETAETQAAGFTDVPENAWYASYVNIAKSENLIGGYADNTFKPNAAITRQDAAVIIARAFELSASASAPSFGDVTATYAVDAIRAVAEAGIMQGYSGSFRPQDAITREELAVVALRLLEYWEE
ncbi:S-layer homology domain-containing protein [Paenibacillus daejeonensis]|uniref:S-layer homology domain-containing protein n=1 Tax=Paenibacillus daejeonensis TaxID=135193 RepID=UPI000378EBF9|nr:S-layer homology domain-containing protein [Paenibacillus daejeonensis]